MRSQDVLHSAYIPHFRAQMNCVPVWLQSLFFTPSMTTEEMRETRNGRKGFNINKIRNKKSAQNVLDGKGF
jgi:cytochrome c oxidase subunit 2